MSKNYLQSAIAQFRYYKLLGEKTFEQLNDAQLFEKSSNESNSIANIVKHLYGNMLSRWTDFMTSDGEKDWRDRDSEFTDEEMDRKRLLEHWEAGWTCLFNTLESLKEEDLEKIIFIRNQGHTVLEAINRQLAHYPYHVGQIVFIGKMLIDKKWNSLSIPKNQSANYNKEKFLSEKKRIHFTDEFLKGKK